MRLFHRGGSRIFCSGLGLGVLGSAGHLPRGSRSRRDQAASEEAEQPSVRTGGSEGHADAGGGFDDAGADLQEPESDRGELGGGQLVSRGDGVAQAEHEPVGGGVQDEAHLVGQRRAAAGAVGGELGSCAS